MPLDDGWSCRDVAAALLLDDDTVGDWRKLFEQRGIEGLASFDMGGSAGFLSAAQEDALRVFVSTTPPRSTGHVGAWIEKEFGLVYESRSGLIALPHRLGLEYHKPNVIPRKLNGEKLAIEQTSGRQRINIHGAIDLETGHLDDRGPDRRRSLDDQTAGIDRGAPSVARVDPCFSRQRELSPRQDREGMAGSAGPPHKAAFHPGRLPAFEPDRAVMGPHAQKRHS
jgi:transposase